MKSKCSFIFKAMISLLLVLLIVFGTMVSSLAVVVDDIAGEGVDAELAESGDNDVTFYIYPADIWSDYASYTIKANANIGDNNTWRQVDFSDTGRTISGKVVYQATISEKYGGVDALQIQKYSGSTWIAQVQPYSSWTNSSSFSGKIYNGTSWVDLPSYDPILTPLNAPTLKYNNATTTPVDLYGTSSATLTWENVSNASSYELFKDGVSLGTKTSGCYISATGSYTLKAIGDGTTYSDSDASNAIQINFHVFYLLGLKDDYDWDIKDANKMTYNSTSELYEITRNLYSGSTTYGNTDDDDAFKVYDSCGEVYYGKNSTTLTTSSTSADLSTSGSNVKLQTKNLSSVTSSTVPYKFTYNASTKTVTVYYPMKVTYNMKSHGTNPNSNGYVVAYGSTITAPAAPTATGYTFGGWYKETGCTNAWNFSTDTVTADTVLYAKWTPQNKTLTVQARAKETSSDSSYGSSAASIESQLTIAGTTQTSASVTVGTSVTVTAPSTDPDGYVFQGWYNGSSRQSTNKSYTFSMSTGNLTLTARYDRKYTLTINAGTNGKVNTNQSYVTKTVYYNDVPDSFTISPNTGYMYDSANSTNLSTYYTVSSNSATGKAANSIIDANKVNATITVAFKALSYTVTTSARYNSDGTYRDGNTGGTVTVTNNGGGNTFSYNDTITVTATAESGYMVEKIEYSTNGGSSWSTVTTVPTAASATYNTATMTNNTFKLTATGTSTYQFRATFKAVYYITLYNTWMNQGTEENEIWVFVAAPPRSVIVGDGTTTRATYSYKAGTAAQRGEDGTGSPVTATGDYYEGNKLLVYAGEKIKLNYTNLASSDAIRGVFFNNALRYSTELEGDNKYIGRVQNTNTYHEPDDDHPHGYYEVPEGQTGDDSWDYDYSVITTLFADANYYSGTAATTISSNFSSYQAKDGVNQVNHTVEWTAISNYYNIDLELDYKAQLKINNQVSDGNGITITGLNTEGYYFASEQVGKIGSDGTELRVTLDNSDTTRTFAFNGTNTVKDDQGDDVTGFTIKAYNSSDTEVTPINASSAANISYYVISCSSMPGKNVFVNLGIDEKYKMRLANIIVADDIAHKTMITECSSNSTSATDSVGTISTKLNGTANASIADDGTYYTWNNGTHETTNNKSGHIEAYTSSTNNKYLNGGVNRNGYDVKKGDTITYSVSFNSGNDAVYSFIGWFEGTYTNTSDTDFSYDVNFNKKLSSKSTYTHTPSKNTVLIAVVTRDIYIGGTFESTGSYKAGDAGTSGTTWNGDRIRMEFDPTYVVNKNGTDYHGRYYYEFNDVTANTEYKFRCYDTAGTGVSGQDSQNLVAWNQWDDSTYSNSGSDTDVFYSREKYSGDAKSHGAFMFKNNTEFKTISGNQTSSTNHAANGYGSPVIVYFYAYDGGMSVSATYQWSMAYVSAGVGVDCTNYAQAVGGAAAEFNTPTVSVANKTVNNKDVVVTTQNTKYGNNNSGSNYEAIVECQVKEPDGKIVVTASPDDEGQELQAFVCYNLDTKDSWAVYDYTTSGTGASKAYIGNIEIPQNSKIYIVPVYKFTADYISNQHLKSHTVYVRADDLNKTEWGGLVAMYSWGKGNASSGVWPGQLMIPSDDGNSFYAELTYSSDSDALSGVTFNNYAKMYGGAGANFLSHYKQESEFSAQPSYSAYDNTRICQAYDYREPISILSNLSIDENSDGVGDIYDTDEMSLTFAIKSGNKNYDYNTANGGDPSTADFNASYSWEYLTDRTGKKHVDLNGKEVRSGTATYYVVCNYTEGYAGGKSGTTDDDEEYAKATSAHGRYSINWTVYDTSGTKVAGGKNYMSACYADVEKVDGEWMSYIGATVLNAGQPVDGKAVMIAYEQPQKSEGNDGGGTTLGEAVRYSGQWYIDGVNTIIDVNVNIGTISDGVYAPSDSDSTGYAQGSVSLTTGETAQSGENFSSAYPAKVTMKHATNKNVQLGVDSTVNFQGWYIYDKENDKYDLLSTEQYITPSFNADTTYYAFYSASASYVFLYTGRNGTIKRFVAKGSDLSETELSGDGALDLTDASRTADRDLKLAKITDIKVFNHDLTYALTTPTSNTGYTLTYTAGDTEATYTLTVWSYNSSGTLVNSGSISGKWSKAIDVTNSVGNGESIVTNKPSGQSNKVFVGWKKKDDTSNTIISTQANFGYSITENIAIEPVFGDARITEETWLAGIDKNVVTQELTDASNGTIYNDTLVSFKYKKATGEQLNPSTNECGLIIIAQTKEGAADSTYNANFDGITALKMQGYLTTLDNRSSDAAKLSSASYGEAYVLRVKASSLSRLNRADLYQSLDYSKFEGGQYKVMSYVKSPSGTTVFSTPVAADYTVGQKYPE